MNSPMLDQRIRIESRNASADGVGGQTVTWNTVDTVWASIEPLDGEETLVAHRLQASNRYRLELHNRNDVNASMRIIWVNNGNKVLNIRQLAYPGARELYRDLIVEEGAG